MSMHALRLSEDCRRRDPASLCPDPVASASLGGRWPKTPTQLFAAGATVSRLGAVREQVVIMPKGVPGVNPGSLGEGRFPKFLARIAWLEYAFRKRGHFAVG